MLEGVGSRVVGGGRTATAAQISKGYHTFSGFLHFKVAGTPATFRAFVYTIW